MGTPVAGWVDGPELAAVGAGQPPGDVQAEPKPTGKAAGRLIQTRVPVEDPLAVGGWDPGAVVLHDQQRMHADPVRRDTDGWPGVRLRAVLPVRAPDLCLDRGHACGHQVNQAERTPLGWVNAVARL
jgi:hypothetical protein